MTKKPLLLQALHLGIWDSHHLHGLFSSVEKGEAYIKKFKLTDSPVLKPFIVDPHDDIVQSDLRPYMASCKKQGKIKLVTKNLEHFSLGHHFSYGYMYYFLLAIDDSQALEMATKLRTDSLDLDWHDDRA